MIGMCHNCAVFQEMLNFQCAGRQLRQCSAGQRTKRSQATQEEDMDMTELFYVAQDIRMYYQGVHENVYDEDSGSERNYVRRFAAEQAIPSSVIAELGAMCVCTVDLHDTLR